SLEQRGITFQDKVQVLPHNSLNGKHFAVVTLSVANLRSQPKHSAELATQATLGTPLAVMKKQDDWFLVQTPDKYLSWVDAGGIALMDKGEMDEWDATEKAVFTSINGFVYENPEEINRISDLTAGNILQLVKKESDYYEVKLPDGRMGFVPTVSLTAFGDWIKTRDASPTAPGSPAREMMGGP